MKSEVEKPLSVPWPHERFTEKFVRPKPGRALVVGSRLYDGREDRRAAYAEAVGVDMLDGEGVDRVVNLEAPGAAAGLGTFAHIECWSVLEHSRRPWLLAANLEAMLEPGGTIHVTVPFVWRYHAFPSDFWRFTAEGVRELFPAIFWGALRYASATLKDSHYLRAIDGDVPYFPRCEVLGFGVKA